MNRREQEDINTAVTALVIGGLILLLIVVDKLWHPVWLQ